MGTFVFEKEEFMFQGLNTFPAQSGFSPLLTELSHLFLSLSVLAMIVLLTYWIAKNHLVILLEKIVHKSTFQWDDIFTANLFFKRLAIMVPLLLIYAAADLAFTDFPGTAEFFRRGALALLVFAGVRALHTGKIGGRRQTNIGVFRACIREYLRRNPRINQDLTFLVRHLVPISQGLPLEIYVFSADKVRARYEEIQADIFDHLLAIVPEFGQRIFQYPSGYDLRQSVIFSHQEARS